MKHLAIATMSALVCAPAASRAGFSFADHTHKADVFSHAFDGGGPGASDSFSYFNSTGGSLLASTVAGGGFWSAGATAFSTHDKHYIGTTSLVDRVSVRGIADANLIGDPMFAGGGTATSKVDFHEPTFVAITNHEFIRVRGFLVILGDSTSTAASISLKRDDSDAFFLKHAITSGRIDFDVTFEVETGQNLDLRAVASADATGDHTGWPRTGSYAAFEFTIEVVPAPSTLAVLLAIPLIARRRR
jgi:hypothetical protein